MAKGESPGMFTRVLIKRLPKRVQAKKRYMIYDACNAIVIREVIKNMYSNYYIKISAQLLH